MVRSVAAKSLAGSPGSPSLARSILPISWSFGTVMPTRAKASVRIARGRTRRADHPRLLPGRGDEDVVLGGDACRGGAAGSAARSSCLRSLTQPETASPSSTRMISLERTTTAPAPSPLALSRTDRARTPSGPAQSASAAPEHTRCYEPWFEHVDAVRHLAVAGIAVILAQPLAEQLHQFRIVGELGVVQPVAALLVREVDDDHAKFGEFGRHRRSRRRAACCPR